MRQQWRGLRGAFGAAADKHFFDDQGVRHKRMAQRVYIKVVGFTDEERHALNTVFRLSEQCRTMYQLWTPEAREPAKVALLDANSYEARLLAESPLERDLGKLWVGANPPATVWRSFERPIAWGEVIESLDALFAPAPDLDLDLGGGDDSVMSQKQALIVSVDRDRRLYLRARLALAKLTLADEAQNGAEALALMRDKQYDLALVDGAVHGALDLLRQLRGGRHPVRHVAMTKTGLSLAERMRARMAGAETLLDQPPDPTQFDAWLSRVYVTA